MKLSSLILHSCSALLFSLFLIVSLPAPSYGTEKETDSPQNTEKSGIFIELNKLTPAPAACHITLVIVNKTGQKLEQFATELVLFDKKGAVSSLINVDLGMFPAGKTSVRQFEMSGTACDQISRILVNNVTNCTGKGLAPAICLEQLHVTSRTGKPEFGL